MTIDEPETPWASPPKELFSDEGAGRDAQRDSRASASHAACPRRPETGAAHAGGAARGGADMHRVAAQLVAASAGAFRGEWDASDDETAAAGAASPHVEARVRLAAAEGSALTHGARAGGGCCGWRSRRGAPRCARGRCRRKHAPPR